MAYEAADIARMKAGIPNQFQPKDAAGMLSARFDTSVDSERARRLDRFNVALAFVSDPDAADSNPGFLLPGGLRSARAALAERRRREELERSDRFAWSQAKADLDARLAELNAELAAIDKRLQEISDRRGEIAESLDALHDIEELRRSGEKLDARNPAHRALLEAAGLSEDQANGEDWASVIARRRGDLGREDDGLRDEWNDKMRRRGEVVAERDRVTGAKRDIETADTDEARILAERRAQTVLGRRELALAASETSGRPAKMAAAEAVANAEAPERRAESLALNRKAVAGDRAGIFREDGASFELDDKPPPSRPPAP